MASSVVQMLEPQELKDVHEVTSSGVDDVDQSKDVGTSNSSDELPLDHQSGDQFEFKIKKCHTWWRCSKANAPPAGAPVTTLFESSIFQAI